eukprot:TRINITY_DN1615_c1_g5_i1.p2 TRINITY_DN1615_c1_g5~~TRINITY_DN1615_c1_g5_i1.p2  ORF type:complete len:101 (+),score=0.16 TRINITY_DN1615_c1_g5_i1:339-641(+)
MYLSLSTFFFFSFYLGFLSLPRLQSHAPRSLPFFILLKVRVGYVLKLRINRARSAQRMCSQLAQVLFQCALTLRALTEEKEKKEQKKKLKAKQKVLKRNK